MKKAIKQYLPTAEAIQRLLHPYAEVVVHDIQLNQIVAIYHPFSKRRVGDSSFFAPEEEMTTLEDCIGPYEKKNFDGKTLKSVSSVIRDEKNKAVGLLCINLDISMLATFQQLIANFIGSDQLISQPEPLFKDDWKERIHGYLHSYLQQHHLALDALNRQEKIALIHHLHEIGVFTGKNAAQYVAELMHVSRATVYNYLAFSKIK